MKRREFLAGLGITAGAIAFRNALPVDLTWFAPKDVIPHAGKANPEWLAAEALAALEQHLEGMKTLTIEPMTHLSAGVHMLGIDVNLPDEELERPLDELRAMYISPAMAAMANEIHARRPDTCFPMPVPKSVDWSRHARSAKSGIDLRLVRLWTPDSHRDEEGYVYPAIPARIMTRFDIAIA